jgi:hypothetical protein
MSTAKKENNRDAKTGQTGFLRVTVKSTIAQIFMLVASEGLGQVDTDQEEILDARH